MTKWKYFDEAEFINKGAMEDPILEYKGEFFDYYLIEDSIYEQFKEYADENGIIDTEKNFEEYCRNHQEDIREYFELASEK